MYFAITSSVTLPELQQKYPRAHRWRPQNCFLLCGNSAIRRVRRLPFQPLPQPTDRSLRRYGYEKVHVVSGYVPLPNRDLVLPTDVADQVPYPRRHFPTQRWPPIFRYPYQMQMDLEYGMRAMSVVRHPSSLICGARAEAVASRRGLEPTQTVTVTAVTSPDHKTLVVTSGYNRMNFSTGPNAGKRNNADSN